MEFSSLPKEESHHILPAGENTCVQCPLQDSTTRETQTTSPSPEPEQPIPPKLIRFGESQVREAAVEAHPAKLLRFEDPWGSRSYCQSTTSEAHTVKDRHPERNEVKPKDLHSPQPSTTHQENKNASTAPNRVPQVRKANLGIAPCAIRRNVENGTKHLSSPRTIQP
jgi:hypothetical protein